MSGTTEGCAISPANPVQDELTFAFIRPPDRRVYMRTHLLEARDDVIIVTHASSPSKPFSYLDEVVMDAGYRAVWFLFKDQPYDVGRFYRQDGTWTGYYADVLEPVRWSGSDPATLRPIVDLFLDLWIAPDGRFVVLDEDEFEEAASMGILTSEQIDHARRTLETLVEATRQGVFPPDIVRDFDLTLP